MNVKRIILVQQIQIHLTFLGFAREPEEITSLIGLEPSQRWLAGDPIGKSVRKYRHNGWRVSALTPVMDVEQGVAELLHRLQPHWDELRRVSGEARVELGVVIYADGEMPSIHFRSAEIQRLSELAAEIDIDLYCLGADEEVER